MDGARISNLLIGALSTGWHRWATWFVCVSAICLLGALRTETDVDFTFASLAILPVLVIAWVGGRKQGLVGAFIAAAMWTVADIAADRQFSTDWIPWANALTLMMTYGLVALLAAQVRHQFEREYQHASQDALTGLQNRRAFLEAGTAEVERARRYAHPLAVIFLDLDDFKQLNDTRGHEVGDEALQATAQALLGALRSSDRVARLGGDEFGVLLPEIDHDAAAEAGRKICLAVNAALERFSPVKASIGTGWFGKADREFSEMLKVADELMYEAKERAKKKRLVRNVSHAKPVRLAVAI